MSGTPDNSRRVKFRNGTWKTVSRLLVMMALAGVIFWVLTGGKDLGERAGFFQGLVAVVLLWVTWASIDRADRQIEIAQGQVFALTAGERDHLIYVGIDSDNFLTATNLSRYPALIQNAFVWPKFPRDILVDEINLTVLPGENKRLMSVPLTYFDDIVRDFDDSAARLISGKADNYHSEAHTIEINYIYGGMGSTKLCKVYVLTCLIGNEYYSVTNHPWKFHIYLSDFTYEISGIQDSMLFHIPIRNEFKIPQPDDVTARQEAEYTNRDPRPRQ